MIQIIGAVLVILGCGAIGYIMASNLTLEITTVQNLISILEHWKHSINYHQTALPELCRMTQETESSILGKFFGALHEQLSSLRQFDALQCTELAFSSCPDLPASSKTLLQKLSKCLGKFDINGQIQEIDSVLSEANSILLSLQSNLDSRKKCYRTLGICAGIALAILII